MAGPAVLLVLLLMTGFGRTAIAEEVATSPVLRSAVGLTAAAFVEPRGTARAWGPSTVRLPHAGGSSDAVSVPSPFRFDALGGPGAWASGSAYAARPRSLPFVYRL